MTPTGKRRPTGTPSGTRRAGGARPSGSARQGARPQSAARPDPGSRTHGGARPAAGPRRGRRTGGTLPFLRGSTRRLVVVGAVLVLLAIMLVPTARAYFAQQDQNAALGSRVSRQQQTVDQLQQEIQRYDSDAYVEQQARERLGWVKPGETAWRVVGGSTSPEKEPHGGGMAIPVDTSGQTPFYERVWTSVLIADRNASDPAKTTRPLATTAPAAGTSSGG